MKSSDRMHPNRRRTRWRRWVIAAAGLAYASLLAERVWRSVGSEERAGVHADMPAGGLTSAEQRALYLEPAGLYSRADIDANGGAPAAEIFVGFQAKHDFRPRPGDRICPITRTKANPKCTWVVGGREYAFCCPPCIDEFVRLAKDSPEEIRHPDAYVQQ